MKNVDKLRELEREKGRLEKKIQDQEKALAGLRGKLEEVYKGRDQLGELVDGILMAVTLEKGTEEQGARRLELSRFDVGTLGKAYRLHVDRAEEGYVLRAIPRKGEETGNAG